MTTAPPNRPLILHISGEYPDPVRDRTTLAVKNFIDRLDEFDHAIVSLKRHSDPRRCYVREFEWVGRQKVLALGYWAPPGGLLHRWFMRNLTDEVDRFLGRLGARPTLVMAHKLTIEGVVALNLKRRAGLPYVCSVRGEVESKFFRFKPELRGLFGDVIGNAEALYFVSAWFRRQIEERYPGRMREASLLPNFVSPSIAPSATVPDARSLVTVMDLNVYRRKGLPLLLEALALARRRITGLTLDVIGWTSPSVQREIDRLVARADLGESVRFLGFVENAEVIRRLPAYAGFVLPSRNETFGMAYVEALFAGVPILYSAETGIDGYLDEFDCGVRVPLGRAGDLADGLEELIEAGPRLRRSIRENYDALRLRFSPEPYLEHYRALVYRVANGGRPANTEKIHAVA